MESLGASGKCRSARLVQKETWEQVVGLTCFEGIT